MMLVAKNPPANAGDIREVGSIRGSRGAPGGGHGNARQYSCLENPQGQRSLADFSPCGHKELDTTERLSTTLLFGTADIGKVINVKRFCNLCSINIFFINIIASFVFQKSINSLDASKCIVYLEFLFWHHF